MLVWKISEEGKEMGAVMNKRLPVISQKWQCLKGR